MLLLINPIWYSQSISRWKGSTQWLSFEQPGTPWPPGTHVYPSCSDSVVLLLTVQMCSHCPILSFISNAFQDFERGKFLENISVMTFCSCAVFSIWSIFCLTLRTYTHTHTHAHRHSAPPASCFICFYCLMKLHEIWLITFKRVCVILPDMTLVVCRTGRMLIIHNIL